jgi:putative thioredoxin
MPANSAHVLDITAERFETDVLQRSLQTPVLIDFWAEWCGPCKTLGPVLEKLAAEYNGAFVLAKVDVEAEQELGAAFQVRSIPMVVLVKDGQLVDGFQGALPEGQLRQFLQHHGIAPAAVDTAASEQPAGEETAANKPDPQAEIARLRAAAEAEPDKAELKLDLALALLHAGETQQAEDLIDGLPANLATDDRAVRARARLGFAASLRDAPSAETLEAAFAADPTDLRALHLLGVHHLISGRDEAALEMFLEMLKRDKQYQDGLPRKTLIDAFRVIEDEDLVGRYRRKMASLLLV